MAENESPIELSTRLALRPREAARALGVSERTLRAWLHRIPHARIGDCVVIPTDALRAWLLAQARQEPDALDRLVQEELDAIRAKDE